MLKKFYIPATRITPRVQDLVNELDTIYVEGTRYLNLIRRPKGYTIHKQITNIKSEEIFVLYN